MADPLNPFSQNILGVQDLVENQTNKVQTGTDFDPEGAVGDKKDSLSVELSDAELLILKDDFLKKWLPYEGKIKPRQTRIRESYLGKNPGGQWLVDSDLPGAANLQFEATETFLAAAIAKSPAPIVWCDNTPEGNSIATSVKTMLQFHADQLALQKKFSIMVRQWSMDLIGVLKPGWDARINDVMVDNRKAKDYVFDPEGYVDAYGDFSSWYGERIKTTAEKLAEMFPQKAEAIKQSVDNKMGTECTYTEWWPNDDYCFITFKNIILDKFKNPFFNWSDETGGQTKKNHFAHPKKPGIFLSVYSLQEQPHDITSNLEQNIPNQKIISTRTEQIDANISAANNGYAYSEDNFNEETAKQAANARKKGNPILIPSGGPAGNAIIPLDAQSLPASVFTQLETAKNDLRSSWGVQGITADKPDEDQTARGMILNQSHDTSRIGGGIGKSVEQVADNVFNWLVQLYYVFYDEPHFAAVMGNAKAVEYVTITAANLQRQLIVSVSPDSMKPKDEVTQLNLAQALYDKGAIGPKTLLKMVDFPDADEAAADGVLWKLDPAGYFQLNFPEYAARLQQQQAQNMMGAPVPAGGQGGIAPEATTEPAQPLSMDPASAALSEVPIPPLPANLSTGQ